MQWFIKVGRWFSFQASKLQLLLVCHNEKSVCYKKNSTIEKRDYLASRFFLVGKRDTSLKNGTSGHPASKVTEFFIKQNSKTEEQL
jgi:hypothetical protein